MSHTNVGSLPSLAHPLIINPSLGIDNYEARVRLPPFLKSVESLRVPPFPEIDLLNYAGFNIPHLHWIGLQANEGPTPVLEFKEIIRHALHEDCHGHIARAPFSRIRDFEVFKFYDMMFTTFEEGQERIPVPLCHDLSRNELEKQWGLIVRFTRASRLIEELYAVRFSLMQARDKGLISNDLHKGLVTTYKNIYDGIIPGYEATYNMFGFIARKIGESASDAVIETALGTIAPEAALIEILSHLLPICIRVPANDFLKNLSNENFERVVSEVETNDLRTITFEQAYLTFNSLLDELDPDDSRYRKKWVLDYAIKIVKQECLLSQYIKDEIDKFELGSPTSVWVSVYSYYIHSFYKWDTSKEGKTFEGVFRESFILVLEAIRQQLTQGKGLLCPFWFYWSDTCCGGRNRALLEKVWECTSKSSCKLWQRLGCLGKDGGAHVKQKGKNTKR